MITKPYIVVKRQRGTDGQWFDHRVAASFCAVEDAVVYAASFAHSQHSVGGTSIDVRSRRGGWRGHLGATITTYRTTEVKA